MTEKRTEYLHVRHRFKKRWKILGLLSQGLKIYIKVKCPCFKCLSNWAKDNQGEIVPLKNKQTNRQGTKKQWHN